MLDISFIRQNEDIVKMAAERRGVGPAVQKSLTKLIKIDDARKSFTKEQQDTPEYAACVAEWRTLMLEIPNLADISTPQTTTEVERVGETKKDVDLAPLVYMRDGVRVYTRTGTQLLESVASVRESFFTQRGYEARVVVGSVADVSHFALLERPQPGAKILALGAETIELKHAQPVRTSSVARGVLVTTASHAASVELFEGVRKDLEEFCALLRLSYTLELVGVDALPLSAVKMYRLILNAETPVVLAEWYYEHDYTARRYGCMYEEDVPGSPDTSQIKKKRKFAHTVRLSLGEAHAWVTAVVTAHTRGDVCHLPTALQARFENGIVPLT